MPDDDPRVRFRESFREQAGRALGVDGRSLAVRVHDTPSGPVVVAWPDALRLADETTLEYFFALVMSEMFRKHYAPPAKRPKGAK
jgi:hypothetical protein